MAWWLLPAASWVLGAALVVRCAATTLTEARLALRSLDDLRAAERFGELSQGAERLHAVVESTRVEVAHPVRLLRAAAGPWRRRSAAPEP